MPLSKVFLKNYNKKKYLGSSKLHSDQKEIMDQRKDT